MTQPIDPTELEQHASLAVAQLVTQVYRSLTAESPHRADDALRFTLQFAVATLAQSIGLLARPQLTSLLGDPVSLPIHPIQLAALRKASEADWTCVDPHVLGAIFQSIMDADERHATGAHYTPKQDIMRVVGPTIVEPWRARIDAATTLEQLRALRRQLLKFRVLDPACGTGDFLYVAFRQLFELDTALLLRMQEFHAGDDDPRDCGDWRAGIPTTNVHGIDINERAVELARVTLAIAQRLAFEERHQLAPERFEQAEEALNLEPSILCADALFVDWPVVDAIVGNPPILGDRKLRAQLGAAYIERLKHASGVDGVVDLSCYWFRRAHDHLPPDGRAGLVGTSGLRVGKAREASLDYLVERGGTITSAVSSMLWRGDANLDVCMVNWVKGAAAGPHRLIVDGRAHLRVRIATHLGLHVDVSEAKKLAANRRGTAMGVIFGSEAFMLDIDDSPLADSDIVRPVATGTDTLTGVLDRAPTYCVHLGQHATKAAAQAAAGPAFAELERRLLPAVRAKRSTYEGWLSRWWQPWRPRAELFVQLDRLSRYVACSNPQARPIFVFLSTKFIPTNTMQVFAFDDDYSFGIIQSDLHWAWLNAMGGKVSVRPRYTAEVWRTFPWPQHPSKTAAADVAAAARALRATRRALMVDNGWSLRALHRAADTQSAHPLEAAQARLDDAVATAYDRPAGQDPLEFLLEQNLALAEHEQRGVRVRGPGLPPEFHASDPRWSSDDCIEPPPRAHRLR